MLPRPSIIAIDGPAGSGKSAISQRLATDCGYILLDTGVFYRAITYAVLQNGVSLEDEQALQTLMNNMQISVISMADGTHIFANGEDITHHLRTRQIEENVSAVSKVPLIRSFLLPLQRQVAEQGNIIMVGRDIGTVVLPQAELKLYIDASLHERARRRYQQLVNEGKAVSLETIKAAMAERDKIDSERALSPLSRAEDAIYIMTDEHTLEEVVEKIRQIIENVDR